MFCEGSLISIQNFEAKRNTRPGADRSQNQKPATQILLNPNPTPLGLGSV